MTVELLLRISTPFENIYPLCTTGDLRKEGRWTVCCRVLQCVEVCCNALQGVAGCCRVSQGVAECHALHLRISTSCVPRGIAERMDI